MVDRGTDDQVVRAAVGRASALLLLAIVPPLVLLEALSYAAVTPSSTLRPLMFGMLGTDGRYPIEWLEWFGRAWVPALAIASGACLLRALPTALPRAAFGASSIIVAISLLEHATWSSNVLYPSNAAALVFAAVWLLVVAWLSARRTNVPALAAFGLPALAIWSLGELLATQGWANGAGRALPDDPLGGAIAAAYARLDQPWAAASALLAASVLGIGALAARARAERLALLALAAWAASRGALDAVELQAARSFVQQPDGTAPLLALGANTLSWDLVTTAVAVALAIAAGLALARTPHSPLRAATLALFGLLVALAACFAIDVARLPGAPDLTSSQSLARVLKETRTQALASAQPGGSVPAQVAVLHADRSVTLIAHGRTWRVDDRSLPILQGGLLLLADDRVSIAELVQLVERLPDEYALRFGRIANHLDAGSTTQRFEAAAHAALSVSSQWLASPRLAAQLAPGEPLHRVAELPPDRSLRMLPSSGVLVVDQARRDTLAEAAPSATTALPSTAWTLIAWGW